MATIYYKIYFYVNICHTKICFTKKISKINALNHFLLFQKIKFVYFCTTKRYKTKCAIRGSALATEYEPSRAVRCDRGPVGVQTVTPQPPAFGYYSSILSTNRINPPGAQAFRRWMPGEIPSRYLLDIC